MAAGACGERSKVNTMSLWVYAFVGRGVRRRTLAAFGRPKLRAVGRGKTIAIVADREGPTAPTVEALREHDATVRRIARVAPAVLPARFGSVVESDAALLAILRASSREFEDALRLVDRQAQMTLRVFGSNGAIPRRSDRAKRGLGKNAGTNYLKRLARTQSAPELDALRPLLEPLLTAERIARHDRGPLMVTAYHLIPCASVSAYRRLLRRHSAALGFRAISSGPWPPYAFVPELRR